MYACNEVLHCGSSVIDRPKSSATFKVLRIRLTLRSATAIAAARESSSDSADSSGCGGEEGCSSCPSICSNSANSSAVMRNGCICVLCGGTDKLETILRYRIRSGRGGYFGITRVEQQIRIICICRECRIIDIVGAVLGKNKHPTCSRLSALTTLTSAAITTSHTSFREY